MPEPSSGEAVYRQIARQLEAQARHGGPGYLFPPAAELARQLSRGEDTVRDAFELLVQHGLITMRPGYGPVVRTPHDREQVRLPAGTTITARMPTLDEVDQWGLDPGVPMLCAGERVWPADRYKLVVGDCEPPPAPEVES